MRSSVLLGMKTVCLLFVLIFMPVTVLQAGHPNIYLYDKDFDQINPITGENLDKPFSTKVTCGLCHDYDEITSGYHFQHGWDVISDTFGIASGKPWLLSNGMMGGWSPPSFRQFAKKENASADEIDLTPYEFVGFSDNSNQASCGSCHAGGGGMEYDREGNRYDEYLTDNPELRESFDGDYYKSNWDKSGVVEADCFLCHHEDYDFSERINQLQNGNYQWAVVAGSRLGIVEGSVRRGDEPKLIYNKRYFNDDGSISLDPSWPPPDDNCMFCHGSSDVKKHGFTWNDIFNPDIHNQQGISCAACHPSGIDHQFARGMAERTSAPGHKEKTITNCKECHDEGYLGSFIPKHISVRPSHLRRITCEACHAPVLGRAAAAGFDVTTGEVKNIIKPDSSRKAGDKGEWKPVYKRLDGQNILPISDMLGIFFGNIDSDNFIHILFQREHEAAWKLYADQITDDNGDGLPEVNTEAEITAALIAFKQSLEGNKRFTRIRPVFLKGDKVYGLDDGGKMNSLDYEFQSNFMYVVSHNVAPAREALGYGGCTDCHSENAHFFKGKIITDPIDQNGQPVTASIGRGLGCNPVVFKINSFHQEILSPVVSFLIIFVVFMVTLHYHRFGPRRIPFIYGSGEIKRFTFLERGIHLFRMISFIMLAITGFIMAFNWSSWQNLLFTSPQQMYNFHIVSGIIFAFTTIMGIFVWSKDAIFKNYDKVWVRLSGGYLGHKGEVPAGRFNAGQKMFYWFTTIFGLLIIVSGFILYFKYSFQLSTICLFSTIHNLIAFVLVAGVLAHAYLGTIANPGTWRVLIDGYVTKTWAKHHHPNWFRAILEEKGEKDEEEEKNIQND